MIISGIVIGFIISLLLLILFCEIDLIHKKQSNAFEHIIKRMFDEETRHQKIQLNFTKRIYKYRNKLKENGISDFIDDDDEQEI